jgi:glycosyltransferase involved in cell wall biosynthesis
MASILYLVGARSFTVHNHMRKIAEVISVWKRIGITVHAQFGGDIGNIKPQNQSFGSQDYYNNFYRKIKIFKYFINSASEFKDIVHNRNLYKQINKNYKDLAVDIIWERSARLHWAGLKLAKEKKIPFVLEWKDHLIDYKFSLFKWLAKHIENKKLKEADFIVVESGVLKNELINMGIPSFKIHVALNGVDPLVFKRNFDQGAKIKKKFLINPENVIIGYLGSYTFYHDSEVLVEAAHKILNIKKGITFLMVGNGMNYENCKRLAKEYDIFNNGLIMIDGVAQNEVPKLLSAMDITVLPGSTDIICPIKIMEYMAAETAVIAPEYFCNMEVINNGINGLLFKPKNHKDLAIKIIELIDNIEKRKQLGRNGKEYVSENLVWEKTWGKVLQDILAKSNINKKLELV